MKQPAVLGRLRPSLKERGAAGPCLAEAMGLTEVAGVVFLSAEPFPGARPFPA